MLNHLLIRLVDTSRRNPWRVMLGALLLAAFSAWFAAGHLGVSTDTDLMFAPTLPWRQRAEAMDKAFPQFRDLLVAVVDAREPEEADATAAELATGSPPTPPISPPSAVPTRCPSSIRKACCSWSRSNSPP